MKTPNLIILNSFLDDYRKLRSVAPAKSTLAKWTDASSIFMSSITSKPTDIDKINQTWEHFSESFAKTAHEAADIVPAQWIEHIVNLGNTACILQNASSHRSRSSAALHAARCYIYSVMSASDEGRAAIQTKIAQLEAKLISIEKTKKEIQPDSADIKNRTMMAVKDHNDTLRELAFLNVIKLKEQDKDEMSALFPGYDFPPPITRDSLPTFSQNNGVKLNQNLPYILHDVYTTIYINKIDDKDKPHDDVKFIALADYIEKRIREFNYKYALDKSSAPILALSPKHTNGHHLSNGKLSSTAALASSIGSTSHALESENKDSAKSNHLLHSNDSFVVDEHFDSAASSSVTSNHTSMKPS